MLSAPSTHVVFLKSTQSLHIFTVLFKYTGLRVMEHLVRLQNERDRRTLEWLRERLSDEAITAAALNCGGASKPFLSAVCRNLGVKPPRFTSQRRPTPSATAERSLATIRSILSSKATSSTLRIPM